MTIDEARAAFPVFERFAYLNAGTNGPLAGPTVAAMVERTQADLEQGRGGAEYFSSVVEQRERVRAKLAATVGVPGANLSLTTSTTNGCNIVLGGLGLGPDDEVLTTDGEHFELLGALGASSVKVRVAAVRELPPAQSLDVLLAEVTPKTRLLALSDICWVSGNRFPIDELKQATGLPLLADGAQSAGAVAVDASGIDYYAFSCQKWLCGPDGTGGLAVREPESLSVSAPSYLSQDGYEPTGAFSPRAGAKRFDSGWTPPPALAGLDAALDVAPEGRFERAAEMAARCRQLVAQKAEVVTAPGQGTLVTFRFDGDTAELVGQLYERGVVVRDLPGLGLLRVSCGWWTTDEDLDRLVAALP